MREQHGFDYQQQRQPRGPTAQHHNVQRLDRRPTQTGTPTRARSQPARDDVEEEYDDEYPSRLPTSTRRYAVDRDGYPIQRRVAEYYHEEPFVKRKPVQTVPKRKGQISAHWLLFLGIGIFMMIIGYGILLNFGAWWQQHQDDATYGNPRTYQVDAVVGHYDSPTKPTHFIAVNLHGQVIVIELPGGDTSKAISYNITTVPDNSSNPPVKLVFQDLNHDGKPDMIIEIGDPGAQVTMIFYNNGSQFVPKL